MLLKLISPPFLPFQYGNKTISMTYVGSVIFLLNMMPLGHAPQGPGLPLGGCLSEEAGYRVVNPVPSLPSHLAHQPHSLSLQSLVLWKETSEGRSVA